MRSLRRFEDLGLLYVLGRTDASMAFDLADNYADVWAQVMVGQAHEGSQDAAPSSKHAVAPNRSPQERGVFLSVAETQKASLARPFRALLGQDGVRGFIVSDEPLPEGAFTPEEKVDAYLERSDAVVVFATADLQAEEDRYTRPNIADEIGRARSKLHLRSRVCVLRQRGVTLPSNINPAYEQLDPSRPAEAYRRAMLQLSAWGFNVSVPPEAAQSADQSRHGAGDVAISRSEQSELLDHAKTLVPDRRHASSEMSLAVTLVGAPRDTILRPAQLEASDLANRLTQQLLFGRPGLFDPAEGTDSQMSESSLLIRQSRASLALDSEATVVVVRPIFRGHQRLGLSAVIEEDVRADIHDVLRFHAQLLEQIDPSGRISAVVPVVALVGANYGAWRTRAEHTASPNSMAMNITGSGSIVAHLTPPAVGRPSLGSRADEIAEDLMILLRRAATHL